MTAVRYAPELAEQAVRLAVRTDAALEGALHRSIDPVFDLADADRRESSFQEAFAAWFRRLELDRFINEMLLLFPLSVERTAGILVVPAARRRSQGADLLVGQSESGKTRKTLVIHLCPESLVEPGTVRDTLLRELQHVEDMLDERFGYSPDPTNGSPARRESVRRRYGILWDIYVESRLKQRHLLTACHVEPLLRSLEEAIADDDSTTVRAVFDGIWNCRELTHRRLIEWSKEPASLLAALKNSREPAESSGEEIEANGGETEINDKTRDVAGVEEADASAVMLSTAEHLGFPR